MFFCNPELMRNCWLDFTLQRTILAPVILSTIVYIIYLTNGSPSSIALFLAWCFIFIWGIKNASDAVIEEINDNTWDFQRQSALSPLSMMLGKLFGSTLFSWYCAFICFFYYFIFIENPNFIHMKSTFIIIMGGLFGQALALLASLQVIPQVHRANTKQPAFHYFIFALLISFIATRSTLLLQDKISDVHWFQFTFSSDIFTFVSLGIFTVWALLGLHRSFSAALQYQRLPLAWIAFSLFVLFYFAGLSKIYFDFSKIASSLPSSEFLDLPDLQLLLNQTPTYTAFFIAQILLYSILVTETLNTVVYKKIVYRMRASLYYEAFETLPLWPISFIFVLITGGVTLFQLSGLSQTFIESFSPSIFVISAIAFMIRDILLFHCLSFSTRVQRVVGAFILYLVLLYMLFPALLSALHVDYLNVIFLPSWGNHFALACAGILIQILLLVFICNRCWKNRNS